MFKRLLTLFLGITSVLPAIPGVSWSQGFPPPQSGPVSPMLHFKFDEDPIYHGTELANSGVVAVDARVTTNNGASRNKARPGIIGGAIRFDGVGDRADTIDASRDGRALITVPNTFSISVWVNPELTGHGQAFLGQHSRSGANQILLGFYHSGYHFRIGPDAHEGGTPRTGWQHLAVVAREVPQGNNQTDVSFYRNGALLWEHRFNSTTASGGTGGHWTFGQEYDSGPTPSDHSRATLDDFILWNGALSAAAVADLARRPVPLVHYVDRSASGSEDGRSWENAHTELQSALSAALVGDEIWVAEGRYSPGSSAGASFEVVPGVGVYGGFAGHETVREERDPRGHPTILDGAGVNHHVVRATYAGPTTTIDGFTITGGDARAGGLAEARGGGLLVGAGVLEIHDCHFRENRARGTDNADRSIYSIGGPAAGGALHQAGGDVALFNCSFIDNSATGGNARAPDEFPRGTPNRGGFGQGGDAVGGAIAHLGGNLTLVSCLFSRNETQGGDGIGSQPRDGFGSGTGLSGSSSGGAFYTGAGDALSVINGSFSGNRSNPGRALGNSFSEVRKPTGGGLAVAEGMATVANSILWENRAIDGSKAVQDVSGRLCGEPNLLGAIDPNFRLESDATGDARDDLRLQAGSPALNVGYSELVPESSTVDLGGNPRISLTRIDLGAYERQSAGESVHLRIPSVSMGEPARISYWVPTGGLEDFAYEFVLTSQSGTLSFLDPPVVSPEGHLEYRLAAGTSGQATFEVNVTSTGAAAPPEPFSLVFDVEDEPHLVYPDASFDFTAATFLTDNSKSARIRGYFQPETRKGIAIFVGGYSQRLPGFLNVDVCHEIDPDPLDDTRSPVSSSPSMSDLQRTAYRHGFDVYTVDWHDPRTYLEDNAMILTELLQGLGGTGFSVPGRQERAEPGEKVALIPVSMGGLISRFALCYLDANEIPYRCDLLLTVDSPHEGAYIPIGYQFLSTYFDQTLDDKFKEGADTSLLETSVEALSLPASKQMLLIHHSRAAREGGSHASERDDFLELLRVNGEWPSNPQLRMAAISNGRGDGLFEELVFDADENGYTSETFEQPPLSRDERLLLSWSKQPEIASTRTTTPRAAAICFYGELEIDIDIEIEVDVFAVREGLHEVMEATRSARVTVKTTPYHLTTGEPLPSGPTNSGPINTAGSISTIRTNLREQIKELAGLDKASCSILDDRIDDNLSDEDMCKLQALDRLQDTRRAWSSHAWEWLPGGLRKTGGEIAVPLGAAGDLGSRSDYHCFIPTVSALGLAAHVSPQQTAIPPDAESLSPFDALYHFGSTRNTTHLLNNEGLDYWLSSVVSHELQRLCGEFEPQLHLGEASMIVWESPHVLEGFSEATKDWVILDAGPGGEYTVPDQSRGLFRLAFPKVYVTE